MDFNFNVELAENSVLKARISETLKIIQQIESECIDKVKPSLMDLKHRLLQIEAEIAITIALLHLPTTVDF